MKRVAQGEPFFKQLRPPYMLLDSPVYIPRCLTAFFALGPQVRHFLARASRYPRLQLRLVGGTSVLAFYSDVR